MYIPRLYKQENLAEIKNFIQENSFAIIVNQVNNRPWATHLPLYLEKNKEDKDVLTGHLSKGNLQWKNFNNTDEVLAIFSGPNSYISSSWYDHPNVPTWNYAAIHIYGKIKLIEGEELLDHLKKLVDKYEQDSQNPVSVNTLPAHVIESDIGGIIGFQIEILEIQAVNKFSQNRDEVNHQNIIKELEKTEKPNSIAVAGCMRNIGIKK